MKTFLVVLLSGGISFCSFAQELNTQLLGHWNMHQVIQSDQDVTAEHNPNQDRWVEFYADGTFKSGGGAFGENTGKFTLQKEGMLLLDSDAGPDDDSQWIITINQEVMEWQGLGSDWARQFKIIHHRTKQ